MLRDGTRFRDFHVNVCSNFGGMGDMVARLPAIKYMIEHFQQNIVQVYWHDYFVDVAKLLLPETVRLRHRTLTEMEWADTRVPLLDFSPRHISSFSMHLTQNAFLMITNRVMEERRNMTYLQAPVLDLPRKFDKRLLKNAVIITTGFTAPAREWPVEHINAVIAWCKRKKYTPVLLGNSQRVDLGNKGGVEASFKTEELHTDGCYNLINKTSLIDAIAIIQRAKAVVGVDNGLLHLASCTPTPVVWGFTSVLAKHRLPTRPEGYKTAYVKPDVSCYGCQSRAYFVTHDFRKCLYGDYQCTKEMTGNKFIDALVGLGL